MYLIFATCQYYPAGGMEDLHSKHENYEEAMKDVEFLLKENFYDIIHVLDTKTMHVHYVK